MPKNSAKSTPPTGEKSPRKPRIARDHSNDYSFYLMQNVPGNSIVAVKRDKTVVAVYSVSDTAGTPFTLVPEKSLAHNVMIASIKQRGGLEAFASLTAPAPLMDILYREIAVSLFLALPRNVAFMQADAPAVPAEVAPAIPNGHKAHEGISDERLAERDAEMRAEDAITGFDR